MNCPKCGSRVRVTDSKHADSFHCVHYNCKFKEDVEELVGWYTQDWVYRKRKCTSKKCNFSFSSVEVPCNDLEQMFKEKECKKKD